MANYNNNSSLNQQNSAKKAEPVKAVVQAGSAKMVKKNFLRQMWDDLVVSDLPTVTQTVKNNILIPGIKKLMFDIILGAATNAFYNGNRAAAPTQHFQTYSNPSYSSPGQGYWQSQSQSQSNQYMQAAPQNATLYNDILFTDVSAAQRVLDEMIARVDTYGMVTVADMFTMAGVDIPNGNWMLTRWGWKNLIGSNVMPGPGGYVLNLPKPIPV